VLCRYGIAVISLEAGTDSGFQILPSGRFAHHRGYLQSEAINAGLKLLGLTERQLRHQQGAPVAGYLVCLQKP
jgi:predicted TPR repeat methyltransferase